MITDQTLQMGPWRNIGGTSIFLNQIHLKIPLISVCRSPETKRPLSNRVAIVSKRRASMIGGLKEQSQGKPFVVECHRPHDVNHYPAALGDKFLIF